MYSLSWLIGAYFLGALIGVVVYVIKFGPKFLKLSKVNPEELKGTADYNHLVHANEIRQLMKEPEIKRKTVAELRPEIDSVLRNISLVAAQEAKKGLRTTTYNLAPVFTRVDEVDRSALVIAVVTYLYSGGYKYKMITDRDGEFKAIEVSW